MGYHLSDLREASLQDRNGALLQRRGTRSLSLCKETGRVLAVSILTTKESWSIDGVEQERSSGKLVIILGDEVNMDEYFSPLGLSVETILGHRLGRVCDIVFDDLLTRMTALHYRAGFLWWKYQRWVSHEHILSMDEHKVVLQDGAVSLNEKGHPLKGTPSQLLVPRPSLSRPQQ